jgi:hypothetical protein
VVDVSSCTDDQRVNVGDPPGSVRKIRPLNIIYCYIASCAQCLLIFIHGLQFTVQLSVAGITILNKS